ncbi:hypothetical protein BGZ73_000460 [Actinomortierella ambigua]|nr:hypothetical protein BGZ73_000460 [Actinomortierella ambigua]
MKSSILAIAVALALATSAFAAPQPVEMESSDVDMEKRRDNCFFPSHCSAFWSGKCENHCAHRGFSHMSKNGCGWLKKRCCCVRR